MAQRIGTVVIAPMRINDDTIQYPIAYQEEIQGGAHSGPALTDRNALPVWVRQFGMTFRVYNDGANNGNYVLKYGANSTDPSDNLNWVLDTPGTATGNGNVKKLDVTVNGTGSLILPANCMLYSVLVNAQGAISLFKAGFTAGQDDLVMGQPVDSGYSNFMKGIFLPAITTLYFTGVTPASVCSAVIFTF